MNNKPLVIITGPTAVGKTELSIELAKHINGEIISADSMQVYKGMDIGTAKITAKEMQGVTHHLIDVLEPTEDFNVFLFKNMAKKAIENIYSENKIPIIVGGTGFYIQAVLYDIEFSEGEQDNSYRDELRRIADENGPEFLHNMLHEVDPDAASSIHFNNVKRVIRALEFHKQTGEQISKHNTDQKQRSSPYDFLYFCLNDKRERIYSRIDARVDSMIENGLVDEVKRLMDEGCTADMVSMKGLGYKEIIEYLDGKITLEEAIYILKRDTRHFAKRQLTWFKHERDVTMIDYSCFADRKSACNHVIDTVSRKFLI